MERPPEFPPPAVFFYMLASLMTLLGLGIVELVVASMLRSTGNAVLVGTVVPGRSPALTFGSQFTLFAMWFDMESNKDLR